MDKENIIFADGVKVRKVADNFFDIGFKIDSFKAFMDANSNQGWVHINICKSKDKEVYYAKLNTWKPQGKDEPIVKFDDTEEVPF